MDGGMMSPPYNPGGGGGNQGGTLPDVITPADIPEGMGELEYFRENKAELLQRLTESGALWIRGFETMKEKDGFRDFYSQLDLDPCQDPLASVGARAVVDS